MLAALYHFDSENAQQSDCARLAFSASVSGRIGWRRAGCGRRDHASGHTQSAGKPGHFRTQHRCCFCYGAGHGRHSSSRPLRAHAVIHCRGSSGRDIGLWTGLALARRQHAGSIGFNRRGGIGCAGSNRRRHSHLQRTRTGCFAVVRARQRKRAVGRPGSSLSFGSTGLVGGHDGGAFAERPFPGSTSSAWPRAK